MKRSVGLGLFSAITQYCAAEVWLRPFIVTVTFTLLVTLPVRKYGLGTSTETVTNTEILESVFPFVASRHDPCQPIHSQARMTVFPVEVVILGSLRVKKISGYLRVARSSLVSATG